ncbi:type II secretion system F family protein, partial [Pseudomonas syringae]|uniref:type II secretion system F family protein n=1 Tax=Pseudomonas syringae TaxID=317 RepID=UPI001F4580BE
RRRILIKGRAAKLPRMSPDTLAQACFTAHRTAIAGGGLTIHFAELYERDEFHLFALGLRVNHRYGGNASELMENLIKLIRDREQAGRQLRAMTGETRMTAIVLGLLPVSMAGYFLAVNPDYLLQMWSDDSGRIMLSMAFGLQMLGCLMLWRMLRSI